MTSVISPREGIEDPGRPVGWMALSPTALLACHLFVPAILAVVAADVFLYQGAIRAALPRRPETLVVVALFLNDPHVVASIVTLADREYLHHYRRDLAWSLALILAVVGLVPRLVGLRYAVLFVSIFNVYHLFAQQFGVSKMLLRTGTPGLGVLKWLTLVMTMVLYGATYPQVFPPSLRALGRQLPFATVWPLLIGLTAFTHVVARASARVVGRRYLWATMAMIFAFVLLVWSSYDFFAILMVRAVHDLTAYVFYCVHDTNRNLGRPRNWLHRIGGGIGVPPVAFVPIASLALASIFVLNARVEAVAMLHMAIVLLHYHAESYLWRRGSLHRRYV